MLTKNCQNANIPIHSMLKTMKFLSIQNLYCYYQLHKRKYVYSAKAYCSIPL